MNLSLKSIGKVLGFIIFLAVLFAAVFSLMTSRKFHIAFQSLVFDSRQHYFGCYELPFYPEVQKALADHGDIIEQLKQVGATEVKPNEIKCRGFQEGLVFIKGDIEIWYSTRKQRVEIEKIIGDNFFGIPYRGYNR